MHLVSEFTHSFSFTPSSELYEWTNVGNSEWGYRGRFQIQPRRTGGGPFKPAQIRLSYIRSLKYHLVVMLGAKIDVIQPQIRIFSQKKQTTAVVKRNKTSWLDRNHRQTWSRLQRKLLIRKGKNKIVFCCYGRVWRFLASPEYIVHV